MRRNLFNHLLWSVCQSSYIDRVPYFPLLTRNTFKSPNTNMGMTLALYCQVLNQPIVTCRESLEVQKLKNY